jgi:hypothetical protein
MVLDRAAKWLSTSMTGVDAQHLETRRLQIEEICRIYNVFPIMVGHGDKSATFASSEAFFSAHRVHTLAPWHRAWTQRMDEMLLDGSGPLWAEFDTRYMVAGSMADRAQWSRTMVEMGVYTRNEIRDQEGLDPLPGLDQPLTPLNMSQQGKGAATTDPQQAKQVEALQRRMDEILHRHQSAPSPTIELSTHRLETALDAALKTMAAAHAENIRAIANDMPITINVPPQPAPDVHVNVQPAEVHFEATVPPSTVVMNGPKSSAQKVERDEAGEIVQTTTTFVYSAQL